MDPVIISILRRVMPNIIANDILGVQNMTSPAGTIFSMRANWAGRVVLHKEHFNHFLRVYNRRKHHHPDYLTDLGYKKERVSFSNAVAADQWCRKTFKCGTYVRSSIDFWFAYERDAMLFTLRWSE
jgi:hypothetical protein